MALQRLVNVLSTATGMKIQINYGNIPWEFEYGIDESVYRIVQGSLSNSFRHGNATKLFVEEQTVRNHVSMIYSKIGIHSRIELLLMMNVKKNRVLVTE